MPPLFIALAVAGLYFLIPKSTRRTIVGITPGSGPIGINTGFATGLPTTPPFVPATGAQTNSPGTSGSGVPSSSPQTQSVSPQPVTSQPNEFYPNYGLLSPRFVPTPVAASSGGSASGGGGCGCGGGHSSGSPSSCSVSAARFSNSGCLAPTVNSLINKESQPFIDQWVANLRSNPVASPFNTYQALMQSQQDNNPPGEDLTPSIGFTDTSIGNNYRTVIRGF